MHFLKPHFTSQQVQFEDVDMGGAVHHPNYFKFIERGRTAAMIDAGIGYDEIMKKGFALVVADARAKYLIPLRYQENFVVFTQLEALRKSSIKIHQSIHYTAPTLAECASKNFDSKNTIFVADLRLVMVNTEILRPCAIPSWLRDGFVVPTAEELKENPAWQRTDIS